jgi:SAM-dependent methyltransferase
LPLEDESVDLIYSEYVLEHVEDIPRTVQELKRVLAPGGRMVHVVPNALDALMEFVRINVRVPYRSLAAGFLRRLLRAPKPGPRLVATGAVVPPPHSEFLTDFADQLDIYGLERYVFPMVEQGLRIERITTTRGINTVLVVESVEPGGS